ncbi:MAG: inverse autotransporter beta domain-containing protein [Gammaproteobacteria bacterium]
MAFPATATPNLRRTALASAIAAAITPVAVLHASGWGRNIQIFVDPGSRRVMAGGKVLQPLWQDGVSLTYLDFRGSFNPGQTDEFNLGLGYRHMVGDRHWILGAYASMDTRNTITDHRFNQVTVGLEALSRQWDLRANYYQPVTDEKLLFSTPGSPNGVPVFSGFDLIQPLTHGTNTFEEALRGFDVEGGSLLPFIPFGETRIYIGTYHFDGDTVKSTGAGVRARLEFRPRKDIILGVSTKHDRLFGTETTFQIKYSFGYKPETGVRSVDERMIQFVHRDIDIQETSELPFRKRTLIDPATPTTETVSTHVVHINNTAAAGGDGSIEKPFNSLAACEAAFGGFCGTNDTDAVVYIWAGNGSSTGLDQTLPLRDNQKLIGQGYAWQPVAGGGIIGGDAFPVLDPGGSAIGVVLANNNEVAGLQITDANTAISGYNVTGFNIHDNRLLNSGDGVTIGNRATAGSSASTGTIAGNMLSGNVSGNNSISVSNMAGDGGKATQTLTLANNTVSNSSKYGLIASNVGIDYYGAGGTTATQTINLADGNRFHSNAAGGALFINSAKYDVTAVQNVNLSGSNAFNDNGSYGAFFGNFGKYNGTASQNVNAAGGANTFNNNYFDGVGLINYGVYGGSGTQSVDLSGGNQSSGNGYYGVYLFNGAVGGTATQSLDLTGTDLSGNTAGPCLSKYYGAGATAATITGATCP